MKKTLLITLFTIFSLLTAKADDYSGVCGDNMTWKLDTLTNTLIISGEGMMYNYKCVNYENTAPWAEHSKKILNINIGDSVTYIGSNAFLYCNKATSVTIGNSVNKIGTQAFACCEKLQTLDFPNSLIYLGEQAIYNCRALKSLHITKNIKTICDNCFMFCDFDTITVDEENQYFDSRDNCNAVIKKSSNTLIVGCKNTVIPNSVVTIYQEVFRFNNSLKSIEIPNSVVTIQNLAFGECENLKTVTFGNSLRNIENYAFIGCESLESIYLPKNVAKVGEWVFSRCTNLKSIEVDPENATFDSRNNCNALIKTSTGCLFVGCNNTVLPNDIKSIGSSAFSHCDGITSVTIPDSVTSIGYCSYASCDNLEYLYLPKSLKMIDEQAFDYCRKLKTVYCLAEVPPTCKANAFSRIYYDATLYVPFGCAQAYKEANGWSEFANIVELPEDYGIDENPKIEISIFPNPATNFVNINCENINNIQIFSADGKMIKNISAQSDEIQVDMNDMSSGEYFFMIETKEGTITRKVVKN